VDNSKGGGMAGGAPVSIGGPPVVNIGGPAPVNSNINRKGSGGRQPSQVLSLFGIFVFSHTPRRGREELEWCVCVCMCACTIWSGAGILYYLDCRLDDLYCYYLDGRYNFDDLYYRSYRDCCYYFDDLYYCNRVY